MMTTRRQVLQGLACAAIAPGPPAGDQMLSSGYIIRRGGAVRRHTTGLARLPGNRWRPFSAQQPFRVASVSKMITAAFGLLPLLKRGALDLDADVSGYLGAPFRHPAHPATPITLQMLLSHTSGVRNGEDFFIPFHRSLTERLQRAAHEPNYNGWFAPPSEAPGRWFAYSDTNYAIVAQIMERATGVRFDRYMHDTTFAPLGLDIGYNWSGVSQRRRAQAAAACRWLDGAWRTQVDEAPPPAPEVALRRADGEPVMPESAYVLGSNGFAFSAHGGLRLSLTDMDALARRLLAMHDTLAPLDAPTWRYTPEHPNGETEHGFFQAYGLGIHTPLARASDSYFGADSADWRGHFGDAYGWMTGLWWNERTRTTLVYALNGMTETDRVPSPRTALTAAEQALIDRALSALG